MVGPVIVLVGALIIAVGAIAPWRTATAAFVGTVSTSGIEGDGVLFLLAAVITAVLGLILLVLGRPVPSLSGILIAAGMLLLLGGVAELIWVAIDANDTTNELDGLGRASVGWGLFVIPVGAIAVVAGGVVSLVQTRP